MVLEYRYSSTRVHVLEYSSTRHVYMYLQSYEYSSLAYTYSYTCSFSSSLVHVCVIHVYTYFSSQWSDECTYHVHVYSSTYSSIDYYYCNTRFSFQI